MTRDIRHPVVNAMMSSRVNGSEGGWPVHPVSLGVGQRLFPRSLRKLVIVKLFARRTPENPPGTPT